MYYCFVKEDLDCADEKDQLNLQFLYAQYLNSGIVCSVKNKTVYDCYGIRASVTNKLVFLRSSCDNLYAAIGILNRQGARLIEDTSQIEIIENWDLFHIAKRNIFRLRLTDNNYELTNELALLLKSAECIFLKSQKKGFSAKVSSTLVLSHDRNFVDFLCKQRSLYGDEFLISNWHEIGSDSIGKKESRFFVIEGNIANASRSVHTISHSVPKSQIYAAKEVVSHIREISIFPSNYVLDVGEFSEDGNTFIDVVEINPISTSMCYVNNSIFCTELDFLKEIRSKRRIGLEYCLDAHLHPDRYLMEREVGVDYSIMPEYHYDFSQ